MGRTTKSYTKILTIISRCFCTQKQPPGHNALTAEIIFEVLEC
nr:MAG TPA: hypothetical protein [Caudoviricetes sp.]